mgnify:CR=1 FL=1
MELGAWHFVTIRHAQKPADVSTRNCIRLHIDTQVFKQECKNMHATGPRFRLCVDGEQVMADGLID